jgi:hypothetical protein
MRLMIGLRRFLPLLLLPLVLAVLIHTAARCASFFLTPPVERRLHTALRDAGPLEMMHDYPLPVLENAVLALRMSNVTKAQQEEITRSLRIKAATRRTILLL